MKLYKFLVVLWGSFLWFAAARTAWSETAPALLVPAEVEKLAGTREIFGAPYPGLLFAPQEPSDDSDEKNHQPYHAVCAVYAAESAGGSIIRYTRRFLVHAPDADSLPLAKRVAKLLSLLHGANRERLGYEHPKITPTVDVWLSRQAGAGLDADIGGEQFRNQIYIYSIFTERSPTEWAREVAHEYGHFALPGVTGFVEPEAWANGVLGERLFLTWLRQDLALKRLQPADIPFITPPQLDIYFAAQIAPLIQKVAQNGPNPKALTQKDAAGMDALIGLILACDSLYGNRQLKDIFACAVSSHGDGFLYAPDISRAIAVSLSSAAEWTLAPLPAAPSQQGTFYAFLPKGNWAVSADAGLRWRLAEPAPNVTSTQTTLAVRAPGWRKITLTPTGGKSSLLTFQRK